jgi:GNAT superfamily N-acetyltransferase
MPTAGVHDAGTWGYVGNVFVVPERRNDGIGRALMEEIVSWAASNGLAHLRLAPSPRSVTFYERLGYRPGSVVEVDPPRHPPT